MVATDEWHVVLLKLVTVQVLPIVLRGVERAFVVGVVHNVVAIRHVVEDAGLVWVYGELFLTVRVVVPAMVVVLIFVGVEVVIGLWFLCLLGSLLGWLLFGCSLLFCGLLGFRRLRLIFCLLGCRLLLFSLLRLGCLLLDSFFRFLLHRMLT